VSPQEPSGPTSTGPPPPFADSSVHSNRRHQHDPRGRAGVGVTIKGTLGTTTQLVIDPSTSLVLSNQATSVYQGHGVLFTPKPKIGAVLTSATTVYLKVGWTNEKPHKPAA
jgi:hypothetical protein